MDVLGLLLIVAGIGAVGVGAMRIRGPRATIRQLDEAEANLARYASWRGKQTGVQADGPTGADEMRSQMRQRMILWGVVIGAGVASILLGLVIA